MSTRKRFARRCATVAAFLFAAWIQWFVRKPDQALLALVVLIACLIVLAIWKLVYYLVLGDGE